MGFYAQFCFSKMHLHRMRSSAEKLCLGQKANTLCQFAYISFYCDIWAVSAAAMAAEPAMVLAVHRKKKCSSAGVGVWPQTWGEAAASTSAALAGEGTAVLPNGAPVQYRTDWIPCPPFGSQAHFCSQRNPSWYRLLVCGLVRTQGSGKGKGKVLLLLPMGTQLGAAGLALLTRGNLWCSWAARDDPVHRVPLWHARNLHLSCNSASVVCAWKYIAPYFPVSTMKLKPCSKSWWKYPEQMEMLQREREKA